MKCPHCLESFHSQMQHTPLHANANTASDCDGYWSMKWEKCPSCKRFIIFLWRQGAATGKGNWERLVHPSGISRSPLPVEVPAEFAVDYQEACLVLTDSPKASAALSRRCLQHVLNVVAKAKAKDLAPQIDEVLPTLPQYLRDMVDAVRVMGNFAAHPIKSTNTGAIIEVEQGEAEWLLDTLESLFDFYFVQPAKTKQKRDAINAKLTEAGKPLLK